MRNLGAAENIVQKGGGGTHTMGKLQILALAGARRCAEVHGCS